jgi:hypothetical protein
METQTPQILDSTQPVELTESLDESSPQLLDTTPTLRSSDKQVQELSEKYDVLIEGFNSIQNFNYDKKDMSNEEIVDILTKLAELKKFSNFITQKIPDVLF